MFIIVKKNNLRFMSLFKTSKCKLSTINKKIVKSSLKPKYNLSIRSYNQEKSTSSSQDNTLSPCEIKRKDFSDARSIIDTTALRKISKPVIIDNESKGTTYPVSEPLLRLMYYMSSYTLDQNGMGVAAPQFDVLYRFFCLRSELFGMISPMTNIPYVLPTSSTTSAKVDPTDIISLFPPPHTHTFGINPNNASNDIPKNLINTNYNTYKNISYVSNTYDRMASYANLNTLVLRHVNSDILASQQHYDISTCLNANKFEDDDGDTLYMYRTSGPHLPHPDHIKYETNTIPQVYSPSSDFNKFTHIYGTYSLRQLPLASIVLPPILKAYNSLLPLTMVINPKVVGVRDEWNIDYEGCFSIPHWNSLVERPIAIDVEYQTLVIDNAPLPSADERCEESVYLSSPLHLCSKSDLNSPSTTLNNQSQLLEKYENITSDLRFISVLESLSLPDPSCVKIETRHVTLRDMVARTFLHETDHLDGITYVDRTSAESRTWCGMGKYASQRPFTIVNSPLFNVDETV